MDDRDALHVGYLLDSAREAHEKVRAVQRESFDADRNLQLAVALLVQRVGEAASRLSPACRARVPGVPWPDVIGMRHRLVHDYMHLDFDIIWQTAQRDLPPLIKALQETLDEYSHP